MRCSLPLGHHIHNLTGVLHGFLRYFGHRKLLFGNDADPDSGLAMDYLSAHEWITGTNAEAATSLGKASLNRVSRGHWFNCIWILQETFIGKTSGNRLRQQMRPMGLLPLTRKIGTKGIMQYSASCIDNATPQINAELGTQRISQASV